MAVIRSSCHPNERKAFYTQWTNYGSSLDRFCRLNRANWNVVVFISKTQMIPLLMLLYQPMRGKDAYDSCRLALIFARTLVEIASRLHWERAATSRISTPVLGKLVSVKTTGYVLISPRRASPYM